MATAQPDPNWIDGLLGSLKTLTSVLVLDWIKLVAAAAIGWLGRSLYARWRLRRARVFWRPFLGPDTRVVLGRAQTEFDPAGLLGVGDTLALSELRGFLLGLGAAEPLIEYADELAGDTRKHNLILIGGPDINKVTGEIAGRVNPSLWFAEGELMIVDRSNDGVTFTPAVHGPGQATDYAVILSAPNPFSPQTRVLVVAGGFGHGTLAGIRYLISDKSPEAVALRKQSQPFECVIEADVAGGRPQTIRLQLLRVSAK